jgi:tRNA dimethylallyltransferase
MPDRPPLPPLLVIAGATATGKTGLSIAVARAVREEGIGVEVISADSRQVYRGLDIGTAKVAAGIRDEIPHHGLDLVAPDEPFSVADFVRHARDALAGMMARATADGRPSLAILVGGTGLYLRALARGLDVDALPANPEVRARVEAELAGEGLHVTVARLRSLAPGLASRIDLANPRRVARALEIAELQGDAPPPPPRGYPAPVAWLGLRLPPQEHGRWIERRARDQFEAGLIEEARALRERYDPALPAFSAIGYREAWAVIDGELTLEQAVALDARRNVQFAKRQATWFRSEPGITWLAASAPAAANLAAALDAAPDAARHLGTAR